MAIGEYIDDEAVPEEDEGDDLPPEIILARQSLIPYCILQYPAYKPAKFLSIIGSYLEKCYRGEVERLMILAPPRHGKSHTVSRLFPAWFFGRNSIEGVTKDLILATYAQDLADSLGRATKGFMESDIYKYIFPDSGISQQSSSVRRFDTIRGETYNAAGVAGPLTGKGGNAMLIDDPYKNRQEADSPSRLKLVEEWYDSVFRTRLQMPGFIVLTMTNWTDRGLARHVLKKAEEDTYSPPWVILDFKALAEEGDILGRELDAPLAPERGFTKEVYLSIKADVGTREWNALYQQRPTSAEGNILKRHWWKYYDELPEEALTKGKWVQSWDMSYKKTNKSDFVVGLEGVKVGANLYLTARYKKRNDLPGTIKDFRIFCNEHPRAATKWVELKANGQAVVDTLSGEIEGIIGINPEEFEGDKTARYNAMAPFLEAGNIWLPKNVSWTEDFVEVCASAPDGEYDDDADALAQMTLKLYGRKQIGAIIDYYKNLVAKGKELLDGAKKG